MKSEVHITVCQTQNKCLKADRQTNGHPKYISHRNLSKILDSLSFIEDFERIVMDLILVYMKLILIKYTREVGGFHFLQSDVFAFLKVRYKFGQVISCAVKNVQCKKLTYSAQNKY